MRLERFVTRLGTLNEASLVYASWGSLNAAADNVVLLPSYFTGTHGNYAPWIGPGRVLDPDRYCIIATNLFGNGVSSSPSHDAAFPGCSIAENVHAQHALLRHLGVNRIALAAGWSLGAMQSLHWSMSYPGMVRAVVALCGTAFCWPVNLAFLRSIMPILEHAAVLGEPLALDLFGRAYCPWAYSAAFFREKLFQHLGHETLAALLDAWAVDHQTHRAADLLAVLNAWAGATASPEQARAALGRIEARCLIIPCDTDAYFTPEDAGFEAACIRNAEFFPLASPFGHCAGAPGRFARETEWIEAMFQQALA